MKGTRMLRSIKSEVILGKPFSRDKSSPSDIHDREDESARNDESNFG